MHIPKPYTAPMLLDRMAAELAYERLLASDLRAQMDNPHYSLTDAERRGISELYDLTLQKTVILEKLTMTDYVSMPGGDTIFPDLTPSKPSNDTIQGNYVRLIEDMAEMGMLTYATLTPGQKLRMQAMMFVNKRHGAIKVTPNTLHQLPEEIRNEIRAFLHVVLGENPKATEMIVEVLRPPKKLRKK